MGKVNLGGGYFWEEFDGSEEMNFSTIHGSASVNVPYSDTVNLQFDVFSVASADNDGDGADSYYGGSGLGAHLNYRDETGALGVFASLGRANVGDPNDEDDFAVFAAGIEGQYFLSSWTLSAQAGFLDSDDNGELVQNAGFINLGAAYYASSKLKLTGGVGYLDGETDSTGNPDDVTQWNWALGVEYLFGKSIPASTYLEYRGQAIEEDNGGDIDEVDSHSLNVGVRFYFGGDSDLMKADREGAGMSSPDLQSLSRFED
jgi:predicted porin